MSFVLIVAILTSGSNGGSVIGFHKFDTETACLNAEKEVQSFKPYYNHTGYQTKCVPQFMSK